MCILGCATSVKTQKFMLYLFWKVDRRNEVKCVDNFIFYSLLMSCDRAKEGGKDEGEWIIYIYIYIHTVYPFLPLSLSLYLFVWTFLRDAKEGDLGRSGEEWMKGWSKGEEEQETKKERNNSNRGEQKETGGKQGGWGRCEELCEGGETELRTDRNRKC